MTYIEDVVFIKRSLDLLSVRVIMSRVTFNAPLGIQKHDASTVVHTNWALGASHPSCETLNFCSKHNDHATSRACR